MSTKLSMNIANLPVEILNHIIVDTALLEVGDILNFIRVKRYFYNAFRFALFHRLALGKPTLCFLPNGAEAISKEEYTYFPTRKYLTGAQLQKFLFSVHEGTISKEHLGWIRHLAISPEICRNWLLYGSNPSTTSDAVAGLDSQPSYWYVARKMCMDLKNVVSLHIRVLGWPRNPIRDALHIGAISQYVSEQRACIGLLYYFPHTQLDLHLETVAEEFLRQVLKHKYLRLVSLNFETVKAEDQRSTELAISRCKDLEWLRVKAINPWSEKTTANDGDDQDPVMKVPQLNNDLPKLRKLHLVNSPNFSSLPESLEVLQIEIGEFDEISHGCWPIISVLPQLRKLHMVNNQVTLPRYQHNPYATPVVPVLGFSTLQMIHAEIPRPEQKVFFIPPKVVLSIANYNPGLQYIFTPCIAKGDVEAIKVAECRKSIRSIEIQSDVMRSTMGEKGFETTDLIKLFETTDGLPRLETLKWMCGGRTEMAITPELARAIMNKTITGKKKHRLQVLAIENRISKPISGRNDVSSHPTFEENAFSTIQRLRRSLATGCVFVAGSSDPYPMLSCCYNSESKWFHKISAEHCADEPTPQASAMHLDLLGCLKPVKVKYSDSGDPYSLSPKDIMGAGMDIEHEELTTAESNYLKRWRSMGGNFMAVTEHGKENDGRVLKNTTGIWEDLFFVDLEKLERFVDDWGSKIGDL